ncbi:MAG: alanine--tRNA ligase [Candidatus Nomurabacteria bacterium]|nr:MAG: alanine--tRNA ligase [Candidatus Nomurabacteria bacterium]HRV76138.1 alanine--tRNA ligase [Candidatus Saccharimonadales bacterium]
MTAREIRRAYLKFFEERGHLIVPRASLVPQDDPTTLFTGSGMQPMVPYLLGEPYPNGQKRISDSQVVFRAVDIDDVGDSEHLTSFEMLGNWSFGDYFKAEQIPWICEFLFDVIGLDINKVYVTCYAGNESLGIPRDDEAINLWQEEFKKRGIDAKVIELLTEEEGNRRGIEDGRIFLYEGKENWWGRGIPELNTPIGDPCGPCSEMFFDFGEEYEDEIKYGKAHPAGKSPRFTEIGNNVFMGYKRESESEFVKLKAPNIDQGAGLERLAMASLGVPDISATDLAKPINDQIELITGKRYEENTKAFRVVTDHIKSAVWLATDGVLPSNTGQGYVLRRLVRRAVKFALDLGISQNLVSQLAPVVREIYGEDYKEVIANFDNTLTTLEKEERVFRQTLQKGLKELEKVARQHSLSGADVFKLYDTYGFPQELTVEECALRGYKLNDKWRDEYEISMQEQRERSRTATAGQFKGGLQDHSDIVVKYHTATHLMHRALRNILGDHVIQRGSNITPERLRFDFSHPEKMTPEQIKAVEDMVNEQIQKDWPMTWREENTKEALDSGVMGAFGDKYGEMVKVYTVGDPDGENYSREICGGPHVKHTGKLSEEGKKFKILKEESSSVGIRRIKAALV